MNKIDPGIFGEFIPIEKYLYYNEPLIFSITHNNKWFYVHCIDQDKTSTSYMVCETTPDELKSLERNEMAILPFLKSKPIVYFANILWNSPIINLIEMDAFIEAYIVDIENYLDSLPKDDVYLYNTPKEK